MGKAKKRHGKGFWTIEHKGKNYRRKMHFGVVKKRARSWVIIDGKRVYCKV